jgi:predicted transcriptional regulator
MQQKYVPDDDFGSFLLSVQRAVNQSKGQEASMRIMYKLSRNKETRVEQMMTQVKVSWSEFTEGLKYLEDAGLVRMDDDEQGGTLRLTEEGLHWAQTMSIEWKDGDEEGDH